MKQRLIAFLLALCLMLSGTLLAACTETTPEITDPEGENANEGDSSGEATEPEKDPEPEQPKVPHNPDNKAPASLDVNGDGEVKILSLGNSFSVNTYTYLHPIMTAHGVENLTLGNLYYPACNLQRTAGFVFDSGVYQSYYKFDTEGKRTITPNYSATKAIAEEDWDIITFQQASGMSGRPDTYTPYTDYIIGYLLENRTVKDGLIVWHMTWAYEQTYVNDNFHTYYENDQMTMYESIVNAAKQEILTDEAIAMVIPAGTAVQNARTSSLGDTMTKDGYHLNNAACYLAGYAWYTSLTGQKVDELKFVPADLNLSDTYLDVVLDAANAVVDTPFEVTEIDH